MPNIITKALYKRINKCFYISTYTDFINKNNKTEKIKFIVDYYNNLWSVSYPYNKYLTIDETMCAYKGKICLKQ